MYYIIGAALLLTAWMGWELYRAPVVEDEPDTLLDDEDPTDTCWDDDLNHTEGHFH